MSGGQDGDGVSERRGSSAIDTHTLNPGAARLAEDEGAFLDHIHDNDDHLKQDELAEWIGGILGEDLNPATLFDDLSNGVRLLYLAKSIHLIKCAHLKDSEYKETVKNLQPDEFSPTDHGLPKRASLIAKQRSNIAKFLEWCRHIDVPLITLFETADLTQKKNLRQVTTCLFYVCRIAARFGIEPPSSVKEEIKKEEAKLLRKTVEETSTSKRRSPSSDTTHLILNKPPIYEHEEDDYLPNPANELQDVQLDSEKYDRTSTPFSISCGAKGEDVITSGLKPILPVELKSEEEDNDAVVVENQFRNEETHFHFDSKPFIESLEIGETTGMVIPVDNALDQQILKLDEGSEVPVSSTLLYENENSQRQASDSFDSSSSSEENEYHTTQDTMTHDLTDLTDHTAYVDDISDKNEAENAQELNGTYIKMEERVDAPEPVTSSKNIPDIDDMMPISPYGLHQVPADIVVARQQEAESSDEFTTDEESYVSDDVEREVTFTDVGVGTDDFILKPEDFIAKRNEIMINYPPYFEIATRQNFHEIPSRQYIVAPARQEDVYAVSKKASTRQREAHANPAYETESDSQLSTLRAYDSINSRQATRRRQDTPSPAIVTPTPYAKSLFDNTLRETGTQTHVSLTQDIVRIINDMDDIPRIRTASSSASSGHVSPAYRGGATVVIRTQYQRTLPTSDRDVAITEVSELQNSRPPRSGSVNSSTRHKTRDPETASGRKEVRRSILRRASSAISVQFEKAVVVAKKYKKQITIISVLLILTIGALAAMLAVFPLT